MNLPQGYTARPAVPDDLEAVVAMVDAWDLTYFGEADNANRAGLQYDWGAPWVDVERDTRLVFASDGSLAAYAIHFRPEPAPRYEAWGLVHPSHEGRGVGSAILDWAEGKSRAEAGRERYPVWNATGAPNVSGLSLLADRGYRHIRTFFQMRMDLEPTFVAGAPPEDVSIRRLVVGADERRVHAVLDHAFTGHFGYVAEPFEGWWEHQFADETFDPSLSVVAEVNQEIVGASLNGVTEGTGWVYELGVLPGWRRRGIGRALLRATFAMFAAGGLARARLGVDTGNEHGALELYRSAGMRPVREWRVFEKHLEPG